MTNPAEVASPTYEEICTFCNEISGAANSFYDLGVATSPDDYLLHQSANFVVVPCVGALTDWYVLIVPRRHVLSTGWLGEEERAELRTLCDDVAKRIAERTGHEIVLFEHGSFSFRDKGGSCHDHAHVHLVATEKPVREFIEDVSAAVRLAPCDDWIESAAEIVGKSGRSYLAIQSSAGSMIAPAHNAPSAFFRKALVSWLKADEGEHDWLVYPQTERLRGMIEAGL
ncbi:HIT domain protein [Nonomuraea sp. NPDC046570]|uniref:HIT domain protein n=1 Tax=Nonomuraea sp. NPDC046570 TaxID=3155255 RepID=UPI0033EB4DE4